MLVVGRRPRQRLWHTFKDRVLNICRTDSVAVSKESPSPSTGTSLLKEKANICESQCSLEFFCLFHGFLLLGEENLKFFFPQMSRFKGIKSTTIAIRI